MIKIDFRTFFAGCAVVILCEALFAYMAPQSKTLVVWAMLGLRLVETGFIILVVVKMGSGLESLGLALSSWQKGVYRGALWCLGFAFLAAVGMLAAKFFGKNPLAFFPNPIPGEWMPAVAYLLGAGLIGPIAEEIFYRGLVFGFFRQWGASTAILGSTVLFVMSHNIGDHFPVTQTVGGLVFAWSYEKEKSLLVPLMIHISGNLALAGVGYWAKTWGA
ncbi:MAG: CPBP family intramembrane metalloprotease [Desulfatibacillum sp.]|nr:CPBP family intramembrane metalloprotease [Desulfatibacillum sp.]